MQQKEAISQNPDIELLRSAAVAAGIVALGYFRRDVKTWAKENTSPVTEADYLVDELLHTSLMGARPDYGWLSEETMDDAHRLGKKRIFVVDPIDGTRGFIRGEDSWTICMAVVENGAAITGVIYAPARNELYEAALGEGAKLNGMPLVRPSGPNKVPLIPTPGAIHKELEAARFDYVRGPALPSLAYRLVQVATGALDGAVARRGAQDWDIAAAAIILSECGLELEDVCVGQPEFNRAELRHGALAVLNNPSMKPLVHEALIKVYGCPQPETPSTHGEQST